MAISGEEIQWVVLDRTPLGIKKTKTYIVQKYQPEGVSHIGRRVALVCDFMLVHHKLSNKYHGVQQRVPNIQNP